MELPRSRGLRAEEAPQMRIGGELSRYRRVGIARDMVGEEEFRTTYHLRKISHPGDF